MMAGPFPNCSILFIGRQQNLEQVKSGSEWRWQLGRHLSGKDSWKAIASGRQLVREISLDSRTMETTMAKASYIKQKKKTTKIYQVLGLASRRQKEEVFAKTYAKQGWYKTRLREFREKRLAKRENKNPARNISRIKEGRNTCEGYLAKLGRRKSARIIPRSEGHQRKGRIHARTARCAKRKEFQRVERHARENTRGKTSRWGRGIHGRGLLSRPRTLSAELSDEKCDNFLV